MKKKSLKFFDSLINSDFLILEKKTKIKENRFLKSNLKLLNNKKNSFSLLNYFELIKTLKQFIRILQFFKNTKNPLLLLDFNNKQFLKISELFFKKYNFILPVNFKKNGSLSTRKSSSFILFLDKSSGQLCGILYFFCLDKFCIFLYSLVKSCKKKKFCLVFVIVIVISSSPASAPAPWSGPA